jgi:hypothetical protein
MISLNVDVEAQTAEFLNRVLVTPEEDINVFNYRESRRERRCENQSGRAAQIMSDEGRFF